MYYLEVKIDKNSSLYEDSQDFVSNVIQLHDTLGQKKDMNLFENEKLLELGFIYNSNTNGFSIQKDFNIEELTSLTKKISELKYHILTHGYIELKVHENRLYFWDKSLIYEGVDTFEYCLKYHNTLKLENLTVLTKSDTISEELLNIISYTRRYSYPSIEFIVENCMWDKKEGYKILKDFITNENEYIPINLANTYSLN